MLYFFYEGELFFLLLFVFELDFFLQFVNFDLFVGVGGLLFLRTLKRALRFGDAGYHGELFV